MHKPTMLGLAVVGAVLASGSMAAEKPEVEALQTSIGPAVCTVSVENAWSVSQAVASGWLLGDGKFAITDLGALKHRGAAKVTLRFADGTSATATQFGMADPSLGLVALRLEGSAGTRKGLGLASEPPNTASPLLVATTGFAWGDQLTVKNGRLMRGPRIADVATRSGTQTPAGVDAFLKIEGDRLSAASGAPVTDAGGTVLAVRLDVAAKGMTSVLAMPASTLRETLLASGAQLKPLTDLPETLWPVKILRLPGEPVTQEAFLRASQTLNKALVCDRCRGAGEIDGAWAFGRDVTCPSCAGTGVHLDTENLDMLKEWSLEGARVAWAPDVDIRTRSQVRKIGVEVVAHLAVVGRSMRNSWGLLGLLARLNQVRAEPGKPQGIILYAQVKEQVAGPDGEYLLLESFNTGTTAAVRVEDLLGCDGMGPLPGRQVPKKDTWFALAGAVISPFNSGKASGVYVLPFEWAPYVPSLDRGEGEGDRRPEWDRGRWGDHGPGDRGGGPGGRGGGPGGGGR